MPIVYVLQDQPSFWTHPAFISLVVSSVITISILLFSPKILRLIYGPKLKLSFKPQPPYDIITSAHNHIEHGKPDYVDRFIRIGVKNIKQRTAKNCRAYLAAVLAVKNDDMGLRTIQQTEYHDFIPLKWAWGRLLKTIDKSETVKPLDITLPFQTTDYVDIVAAYDGNCGTKAQSLELQLDFLPKKYQKLFNERGEYMLKIAVTGDDAITESIWLKINWTGELSTFGASLLEKGDLAQVKSLE